MSLDSMKLRNRHRGGTNLNDRLKDDKLRSLRAAINNSYQATTITLGDGRKFRCLINRENLKAEYDNQIISIPYTCERLDEDGMGKVEKTLIKNGDVFYWDSKESYWIIYLEYVNEDAYFRAQIRRCEYDVSIKGKTYPVYVRGPVETTTQWGKKDNFMWNELNHSLIFYVTKNEDTLDYCQRFAKIKLNGKNWEVQATNSYDADGIIEVYLDEDTTNALEDSRADREEEFRLSTIKNENKPHIDGEYFVYPYNAETYEVKHIPTEDGQWRVTENADKVKILEETEETITFEIITGKSGDFTFEYEDKDGNIYPQFVTINSL